MRPRTVRFLNVHRATAALAVTVAALLVAGGANASASAPVLEFVPARGGFPVSFTTDSGTVKAEMTDFGALVQCTASHGEGKVTGPRSTVSQYWFTGCTTNGGSTKCESSGATKEKEIVSEEIESELVYIDQARDEVGMLMNTGSSGGGVYMAFACGGELVVATGSFLAPVSPLNKEATLFTATLSQFQSVQMPNEYENASGEMRPALPLGEREGHAAVPTGVEGTFTIHPSVPGTIVAITSAEIEAKQREEARQAEAKRMEEAIAKLRDEVAADRHGEESLSAQLAAVEKILKQEIAKLIQEERQKELLIRAFKHCRHQPPRKRARCEVNAERRYGHATAKNKAKGR